MKDYIDGIRKWVHKLKEIVSCHKQLLRIAGTYDRDHKFFINRIVQAENLIKDRTDISVDVHLKDYNPNQIMVAGRYRNADYVQVYTLADNELSSLIPQLREMERYGRVSKVDAAYGLKAVVEREMMV